MGTNPIGRKVQLALLAALAAAMALAGLGHVSAAQASTRSAPPSAVDVYRQLLTKPIRASALPPGFGRAAVNASAGSARARRHHSVGAVVVTLNKPPDLTLGSLSYVVYPSRSDALAGTLPFPAPPGRSITHLTLSGAFLRGSQLVTSSIVRNLAGKTFQFTFVQVALIDGNVAIAAATIAPSPGAAGQVLKTVALAEFAQARLATVRRS